MAAWEITQGGGEMIASLAARIELEINGRGCLIPGKLLPLLYLIYPSSR